uniref:Cytochrome P450 n=1 Tax=Ditylenchus dipsaci TaxID=166011 RepID=A0A915EHQ1_9BILA
MALLVIVVIALFPLACFGIWVYRHLQLRKTLSSIPSPRSVPFLGHVPITKPDVEGFVDQIMGMADLYPDAPRMVTFWAGTVPSVMIYSAELVESIAIGLNHLNKGIFYDLLRPWLGFGLLTSNANEWRPRRKLLTPTFHHEILKNFVHVFNFQSEILVKRMREKAGPNNQLEDVGHLISLCALDIICETSMGQSVNAQVEAESDYVRAVLRINDIVQKRQKNPLMWNSVIFWLFGDGKEHAWALNVLHSFTKKVVVERRQKMIFDGVSLAGERKAFLDLLLEMERNGDVNEKDIQEEGHDTTATGVAWALQLFGCHPEIQEKAFEEIRSVCGNSSDISFEQLGQLRYLECCIKETLRLYPSVPIISRRLGSDSTIGGHFIPADTQILLNIYLIHRDPQYWKDPEVFDPTRFLPENSKGRHAFAFIPFSAGSRNCIGQRFAILEEKAMLCWILRTFRVVSIKRRDQVRHKTELILRPVGGLPISLEPRIY